MVGKYKLFRKSGNSLLRSQLHMFGLINRYLQNALLLSRNSIIKTFRGYFVYASMYVPGVTTCTYIIINC